MTTLAETRDGLEARLNTINGLRVVPYVPEDANYPAAIIRRNPLVNYQEAGSLRAVYRVIVLVPATVDRQQLDLEPYIEPTGAQSIPAAIEADRTLGGLKVDAVVTDATDVDLAQMGLTNVYGLSLNVLVFIS